MVKSGNLNSFEIKKFSLAKRLAQTLLLTTAILSGNSVLAMEEEEEGVRSFISKQSKPQTTQEPLTEENILSALPLLAKKIPDLPSLILTPSRSAEEVNHIVQRIQPYQEKLPDGQGVNYFIGHVKDLTEEQWNRVESFQEKMGKGKRFAILGYHATSFIKNVTDMTENQWVPVSIRILEFREELENVYEVDRLITAVKDLTKEQWATTQERIQPFREWKGCEMSDLIPTLKGLTEEEWTTI